MKGSDEDQFFEKIKDFKTLPFQFSLDRYDHFGLYSNLFYCSMKKIESQ